MLNTRIGRGAKRLKLTVYKHAQMQLNAPVDYLALQDLGESSGALSFNLILGPCGRSTHQQPSFAT